MCLFNQSETVPVVGHHERVGLLVHHAVDTRAAVGAADVVLSQYQPPVPINLAGL